jgi:hypothetical protein
MDRFQIPLSIERSEVARTGDAVPPLGSSMEDGVGNIDSGHHVFALSDEAREFFKTLPAVDGAMHLVGQSFGRIHL